MYEIGRLCVKTAGRDSGLKCVIIEVNGPMVVVDGETRRKKVNVKHLLPLDQVVKILKGASHADVKNALEPLGLNVRDTKPRQKVSRPGKTPSVKTVSGEPKKEPKMAKKAPVKKTAKKD